MLRVEKNCDIIVGRALPRSAAEYLLSQLLSSSSMTLGGVRNLVDAGLYSGDSLVTDRVFALFLVSLFGNSPPLPRLSPTPSAHNSNNDICRIDEILPKCQQRPGAETKEYAENQISIRLHHNW